MLDYPAVAAVVAVIRTGSFEAAALELGVTPSAVSQRVKALEERLGAPLVVRGAPCVATPAGARLAAHFDQVMLLEHDLAADGPGWAGAAAGRAPTLRIAVNADSLATWFPAAVAGFTRSNGATLDLVLDDEAHTPDRIRSGEVLAAVTTGGQAVQGCRSLPLGSIRYIAAASPDYVQRHLKEGVSARTLAHAPVLRFDRRDDLQRRWMTRAFGGAMDAPTHWVPSTQGFLDLTLCGVGWSMTPLQLAAPLIAAGRLVDLKPGVHLDVPLFWQHLRITARLLAGLTDAVRAAASEGLRAS
jgi:transcriptional regulator, ArgP family